MAAASNAGSPLCPATCLGCRAAGVRKHPTQPVFYAAGLGRAAQVGFYVHPSSAFYESSRLDLVDWAVFHEVVYTSKVRHAARSASGHKQRRVQPSFFIY